MENKKNEETIKKQMQEIINSTEVENFITNNEIMFEYDKEVYRVRKPNFKEKQEAHQKKLEKYTSLLTDDRFLLEEAIITAYKKKGINVDKMTEKITSLFRDKNNLMLKLGEALKKNASDTETETYKKEIEEIEGQIQVLTIQKTNLLGASIEHQTMIYYYTFLAYLITERKTKEDKWEKAWKTFEEFETSDSNLVDRVCYYGSMAVGNDDLGF